MLIIRSKDLWSESRGSIEQRALTSGHSEVGGVCQSNRYSIVEEKGGFASVGVSVFQIKI